MNDTNAIMHRFQWSQWIRESDQNDFFLSINVVLAAVGSTWLIVLIQLGWAVLSLRAVRLSC